LTTTVDVKRAGIDAGASPAPPEPVVADISVIVLTCNEETNLPACLESLRGLSCRVFVVDSGSSDRTIEIAEQSGAAVRYHPFENYALQRNWALNNLALDTPWVLNLDADERLTPELRQEIAAVLDCPPAGIDGFLLRRRTMFMGQWIRHGGHYPSYHLRLFRAGRGRCEARRYDQHFLVDGPTQPLRHDYLDIVASSLLTWTVRHARWAAAEANEMRRQDAGGDQVSPDLTGNPIQRRRWWRNLYGRAPLFGRALAYWFYRYVLRLGFLDGKEGLIFHFLQGFWFRFLVDAMIYEEKRA
jgi:glycosyltransferase involved in cell wall biosynthesis